MKSIKPDDVKSRDLLLDVRTRGEYAWESIEGSECDPLQEFRATDWAGKLTGEQRCVVVCQAGMRAAQAAAKLEAAGAKNIVVLEGGLNAWKAAGKPCLRQERRVLPLERQVRIASGLIVVTGVVLGTLVNPAWYALAGFVGAGLVFAGITNWCGLAILIGKMPWNEAGVGAGASCCSGEKKATSCCGGADK